MMISVRLQSRRSAFERKRKRPRTQIPKLGGFTVQREESKTNEKSVTAAVTLFSWEHQNFWGSMVMVVSPSTSIWKEASFLYTAFSPLTE